MSTGRDRKLSSLAAIPLDAVERRLLDDWKCLERVGIALSVHPDEEAQKQKRAVQVFAGIVEGLRRVDKTRAMLLATARWVYAQVDAQEQAMLQQLKQATKGKGN